jgi:hypothetical protein
MIPALSRLFTEEMSARNDIQAGAWLGFTRLN